MPPRDTYSRLPTYISRTRTRYHPYPRVQRRYDRISSVLPVYEGGVGVPLLDVPPSISLHPSIVVGVASDDDVSILHLDGCACRAEASDSVYDQGRLQTSRKWLMNIILVAWRRCRVVVAACQGRIASGR